MLSLRELSRVVGVSHTSPRRHFADKQALHRAGVRRDLLEASDAAFSHVPAILKAGQAAGEIVEGDPARLSLTLSAALQGLVTISTDGKFKGAPLRTLVPATVKHILLGLRPRLKLI